MEENFKLKIDELENSFSRLLTSEEKYSYIIELGRKLPPYPKELRTDDRMISGCQSTLYLHTEFKNDQLFFSASCDALISLGLAALLIQVYSGASPKTILLNPPSFLNRLGIFASLSPSRSNGLASIYVQMKKEALLYLPRINS
jgi:cysteine desulfuration protein SufE